jgi:hypothetical protein
LLLPSVDNITSKYYFAHAEEEVAPWHNGKSNGRTSGPKKEYIAV